MDYELAKKLKDAGFPQPELDTECDVWECCEHGLYFTVGERNDTAHIPTLEELVDACGRVWVGPCEKGWHSGFDGHPFSHLDEKRPQGCGQTPSEAVANLWLAINKKS